MASGANRNTIATTYQSVSAVSVMRVCRPYMRRLIRHLREALGEPRERATTTATATSTSTAMAEPSIILRLQILRRDRLPHQHAATAAEKLRDHHLAQHRYRGQQHRGGDAGPRQRQRDRPGRSGGARRQGRGSPRGRRAACGRARRTAARSRSADRQRRR